MMCREAYLSILLDPGRSDSPCGLHLSCAFFRRVPQGRQLRCVLRRTVTKDCQARHAVVTINTPMTTLASAKTETLFNRLVNHHARKQGANKLDNSRSKPQTTAQTNCKSNTVKRSEDDSLKEILVSIDKALNPNLKFESPPLQFQANRISPPSMNLDSYRGENGESSSPSIDHDTQVAHKMFPNTSNGSTNMSNINRLRRDYERLHHENTALKKRVAMLEEDKQYLIDLVGSLRLKEKKRNDSNKTKKLTRKMFQIIIGILWPWLSMWHFPFSLKRSPK